MHVGRRTDHDIVERDGGDRVEAFGDQVDPFRPQIVDVELSRVQPFRTPDPRQAQLVVVEVRVGDQASGEQVGVHAAGHRGRYRCARDRHVVQRPEGPAIVEGTQGTHPVAPGVVGAT
jgi:hypothetical protein